MDTNRSKSRRILCLILAATVLAAGVFLWWFLTPRIRHHRAVQLMAQSQYTEAAELLWKIYDFQDSAQLYADAKWQEGLVLYREKDYEEAEAIFDHVSELGHARPDFVNEGILAHWKAEIRQDSATAETHRDILEYLKPYWKDEAFAQQIQKTIYQVASTWLEEEKLDQADASFLLIEDYEDSAAKRLWIQEEKLYQQALGLYDQGAFEEALQQLLEVTIHEEALAFLDNHYQNLLITENQDYTNPDSRDYLYHYTYDEEGLLVEEANDSILSSYSYENSRIALEVITGDGVYGEIAYSYTFHENGQLATEERRWVRASGGLSGSDLYREYGENGNLIQEIISYGDSRYYQPPDVHILYTYGEDGPAAFGTYRYIKSNGEENTAQSHIKVYHYDEAGNRVRIDTLNGMDPDGQIKSFQLYFYDKWGTRTRMEAYNINLETGEETLTQTIYYVYQWFHIPRG